MKLTELPLQDIVTQLVDAASQHGPHAQKTITLRQELFRRFEVFDQISRRLHDLEAVLRDSKSSQDPQIRLTRPSEQQTPEKRPRAR